jgi:outer membrane immunogenic protein
MKSLITTAILAATLAAPALSHAQDATSAPRFYGNLGYGVHDMGSADLGSIQGRLGYRYNNWLGVEGELGGGVKSDRVTTAPGVSAKVKLDHEEALYGVGFVPLSDKMELLGRVGYGNTKVSASAPGASVSGSNESWNIGAGAQYHFDGLNGIRADYTRKEFRSGPGKSDVWSMAYSRKF